MKKSKLLLPLLAAGLVLGGCDFSSIFNKKDDPGTQKTEDTPEVKSVTISGNSATLPVGATMQLSASVEVVNGASSGVTWSSSAESVATVSASGLVTGIVEGTVTITATSSFDSSKSNQVSITIVKADWTEAVKTMMQEYLGILVPYFQGSFTWTDEYFEEYQCLTAESKVSGDLQKAIAGFTAAKWEIEDYGDGYYAFLEVEGFQYAADIYLYSGVVSVDVYAFEIITEWPEEDIASALEEGGYDVSLPVFEAEEGMTFQFSSEYDEEYDETYIDIIATPDNEESEISHLDYVALFDETFTKTQDEYGDYEIVPENKSCVIYVMSLLDDDYEETPGFEVFVTPYVADYTIKASVESEFVITGQKATVSVEKIGADIPEGAVVTFQSSDETVATVSAEGVVSALKEGSVVISAKYETGVSSVTLYVKDSLPTAFTVQQIATFKQIHDAEGVIIPFNAHFQEVKYDSEYECVSVTGDVVGGETVLNYRSALLAAGWVDLLEEQGVYEFYLGLMQAFGMDVTLEEIIEMMAVEGLSFEKQVVVDTSTSYWISADVYLDLEDEDATEGAICVDVYDCYIYSYAEAKTEAEAYLAEYEIESVASLPEQAIPASHYYVEDNVEEGYVSLVAFDTTVTLAQLKTALEASGFVLEEATEEGIAYLIGSSSDELLDIQAYVIEGDAEIMVAPHGSEGVTIDFSEVTKTSGTFGAFSYVCDKAKGQSDPAYNTNKSELRLYANNTITFSSEETITSIFFDANTCGESKATGTFTSASTGKVTTVEGGFLWEGSATEVTLTVSGSGQIHINSIDINGGGEGGSPIVGGEGAEALMSQFCEDLFGDPTAYEEYDGAYIVAAKWGTTSEYTLLSAVEEAADFLPIAFVYVVEEPVEDTWDDGDAGAFATYCTEDDIYCEIGAYISGTNVIVQFAMYEE